MMRYLAFWKWIPALPLPQLDGRGLRVLRWLVPLGVLALAGLLGPLLVRIEKSESQRLTLLLAAALIIPLAGVAVRLFIQFREVGPVLVLFTGLFVPLGIQARGSLVMVSLLLSTVFLGLWVLRMLVVERRFHFEPTLANRPLFGFMATVVISLVWSNIYRDVLVQVGASTIFVQISQALVMLCLGGLYLLVVNHLPTLKWLKALTVLLLAGGVLGLVNEFVIVILPVQTRGTFTMWVVSVSLALLLFHRRLNVRTRLLLFALVLGWCYWSFGLRITWLASWLPTLVAIGVLLLMRSWKLLALAAVAAVIWAALNLSYIDSIVNAETDESGHTRLDAWLMNWRVTGEHLLFGTGPAGYAAYYMSYFPTRATATHNNYIDVVAQTGVVGLACYLGFFLAVAWQGWRLSRRLRGRGDFAEAMTLAALAGTFGCIVINAFGDWLIPFAYTQGILGYDYAAYNWLFMAAIPLIDRLTREPAPLAVTHA
jgi:O-antigen ligase